MRGQNLPWSPKYSKSRGQGGLKINTCQCVPRALLEGAWAEWRAEEEVRGAAEPLLLVVVVTSTMVITMRGIWMPNIASIALSTGLISPNLLLTKTCLG